MIFFNSYLLALKICIIYVQFFFVSKLKKEKEKKNERPYFNCKVQY